MSRKKKNGNKNDLIAGAIVLVTAIINLVIKLIEFFEKWLDYGKRRGNPPCI